MQNWRDFYLSLSSVNAGDVVTCREIKGFEGDAMRARVVADAEMHRPAREGMAWVRELRAFADRPAGWEAYLTEWPISLMT